MRLVGDRAWRWFESQSDAARAFGISPTDVSDLVRDPAKATIRAREGFEARPARPKKRKPPTKEKKEKAPRKKVKCVEGAHQKSNGKWANYCMFPGREFDDFDAYRAAKKQRAARQRARHDQWKY